MKEREKRHTHMHGNSKTNEALTLMCISVEIYVEIVEEF